MRTMLFALLGCLVCFMPLSAQVTGSSTLDVSVGASGVESLGKSMAADAYGNVFLVDVLPTAGPLTTYRFTRIALDNTVNSLYATVTGGGPISRLCQNPQDGYVYFAQDPSPSGTPFSTVYRLHPDQGIEAYFSTNVDAMGMAIDNHGMYYLGGISASSGQGVHKVATPPSVGGYYPATQVTSGHGSNTLLLSMVDGTLLAADGTIVWRIDPDVGGAGLIYFGYTPLPAETVTLHSMARSPLNEFGIGALIGVTSSTGMGYAFLGDATGATQANPVLSESFPIPGDGLVGLSARMGDEVQWYSKLTGILGSSHSLTRVNQLPSTIVPGSLFTSSAPGSFTVSLAGRTSATGIQIGIAPGISFIPKLYLPHGGLELDLANLGVIALVNGLGLHGAPNGSNIPANGLYTETFPLPSILPPNLQVTLQAVVCDLWAANGYYDKSNLVIATLP